jgi:hypothetical protein
MAKIGKAKNTLNKSKHSKLMERKKKKIRADKIAREQRLKSLVAKMNQLKNEENS